MRFIVYNIAYGTGSPGSEYRRLWQARSYLAAPERHFRRILEFISAAGPDVVGLVEADAGSRRTRGVDQVAEVAGELGFSSGGGNKYRPGSLMSRLPYFRHHHNALIGDGLDSEEEPLFLSCGAKRLVVTARCRGVRFLLVHLALTRAKRAAQIAELEEMIRSEECPTVLAGDFNTFKGASELAGLLERRGWRSANHDHLDTYPSWKPRRELDYILYSPGIRLTGFLRPEVQFSDHLPLIADFDTE